MKMAQNAFTPPHVHYHVHATAHTDRWLRPYLTLFAQYATDKKRSADVSESRAHPAVEPAGDVPNEYNAH